MTKPKARKSFTFKGLGFSFNWERGFFPHLMKKAFSFPDQERRLQHLANNLLLSAFAGNVYTLLLTTILNSLSIALCSSLRNSDMGAKSLQGRRECHSLGHFFSLYYLSLVVIRGNNLVWKIFSCSPGIFFSPLADFSGRKRRFLQRVKRRGELHKSREITPTFHAGWQMFNKGFSAFLQNSPSAACCLETLCFFPFHI